MRVEDLTKFEGECPNIEGVQVAQIDDVDIIECV